jgi:hypothetical protein
LKADNKDFKSDEPLKRHIKIPSKNLDEFLSRYSPGNKIAEQGFTSTTTIQKRAGIFAENSNVTLKLTIKRMGLLKANMLIKSSA